MSEDLILSTNADKETRYREIFPQLKALIEGETDMTANLANVCAALKEAFGWWWVGFYLVKGEQLVLGPFQGPVACTRIAFGKGVCGTAWKEKKSVLVPDVEQFEGHIACSSASVAEIVIPIFNKKFEVVGVLDIDSEKYDLLDETDLKWLEEIVRILAP